MINSNMRSYMDVASKTPLVINEGIISNIKNWINTLSDPVKQRGRSYMVKFENFLKNKYSAQVSSEVKSVNSGWMWSKLTYKDIFSFTTQILSTNDADLDRALRNPIVNNNLRQIISSLPSGSKSPKLPLTSDTIQSNTSPVSPVVDSQSKEYVSKAISAAIMDGLAYIEQAKQDKQQADNERAASVTLPTPGPAVSSNSGSISNTPAASVPTTPDDLRTIIAAIRKGLADMGDVD